MRHSENFNDTILSRQLLGAARVYLQWFNFEFRHRMTAAARKQLLIDFNSKLFNLSVRIG